MTRILGVLCTSMALFWFTPCAAQDDNVDEITIKTSGKYYWEQLAGKDSISLKAESLELLRLQIKENDSHNYMKIFDAASVKYLVKSRGPGYLVIAYSNRIDENSVGKTAQDASVLLKTKGAGFDRLDALNAHLSSDSVASNRTFDRESSSSEDKSLEAIKEVSRTPQEIVGGMTVSKNENKSNVSVNELGDFSSLFSDSFLCNHFMKHLDTLKKKGKIYYSSNINDIDLGLDNCWILYCDQSANKVLYFLAPGKENRRNLVSNSMIGLADIPSGLILNKLYIYEIK
jgi:hypothetical protein